MSNDYSPLPPDPEELRRQARNIRSGAHSRIRSSELAYSWPQKILVGILMLSAVLLSIGLLVADGTRRGLVARAGLLWERVYGVEDDRVLKLPPPARERIITETVGTPRVRFSAIPAAAADSTPDVSPDNGGQRPSLKEREVAAPASKTSQAIQAYEMLRAQSTAAGQLSAGQTAGLKFKDWRPVRNDPPIFLIALIADDGSAQEIQLIWQVDLEKGQVRALSQRARELERDARQ